MCKSPERPELALRSYYLNGLYIVFILLASLLLGNLTANTEVGTDTYARHQACRLSPTTVQLIDILDAECPDKLTQECEAPSSTSDAACIDSWSHTNGTLDTTTSIKVTHSHEHNLLDQLADCDSVANRTAQCFTFSAGSYSNKVFSPMPVDKDEADALVHLTNISISLVVINVVLLIHSILIHFNWMYGMDFHFIISPAFSVVHIGLFSAIIGLASAPHAQVVPNVYVDGFNLVFVAIIGLVITLIDALLVNLTIWVCCKKKHWFRAWDFRTEAPAVATDLELA